jgi:hypothetical protein
MFLRKKTRAGAKGKWFTSYFSAIYGITLLGGQLET